MSIELKVYDNGDHTCLVWLPADVRPIPGCRGFAINKICNGKQAYLHGAVGFSDADTLDPANPWKFPLQRYLWWDYFVQPGDVVQYSVIPVVGPDKDHLSLATDLASSLTPELTVEGQCTPHLSAYFNKGIVAAQWVSRALAKEPKDAKIKQVVATSGDPLRAELSGLLRPRILSLLADAKAAGGKIFAALYELDDPELIPVLEALGADCSLILGNGAFSSSKPDENAAVRARLRKESQVQVFDRMVSTGHFAHNKFVVFCDAAGNPQKVLTGSTNWTSSGLCTQANNGLIVDDPAVAADFLAAWHRIKDAGNAYPPALVQGNSTAGTHTVDGCTITPWFVATSAAQDLADARRLIAAAKEGILFLFFNPGTFQEDPQKWTLLQNILVRHDQAPDLYVRGVVNQEIAELTEPAPAGKGGSASAGSTGSAAPSSTVAAPPAALDPTAPAPVTLYSGAVEPPERLSHDVLVPQNIKEQFHDWEKELLGASMVNIHSKVIVLDPFGENPVVMTGSHNLGFKASNANDDNLVIIQGNAPLAAAYAVNIIAIFQNYRWNSYVLAHQKDPKVWHGLVDNDDWQESYLTGDPLAEIQFWLGETDGAPAAAPAVEAGGTAPSPPAAAPAPSRPPARTVVAPPKPPAAKPSAKKAPAKKAAATKKPASAKAPSRKAAPAKKTAAKKPPAKKATAKKATVAKKPASAKASSKKAAAAKRPASKKAPARPATATKKAGAAKRTPASKSGRK